MNTRVLPNRQTPPQPPVHLALLSTPIGWAGLAAEAGRLVAAIIHADREQTLHELSVRYPRGHQGSEPILAMAKDQLREYFQGRRCEFNLPLSLGDSSPFAAEVMRQLGDVPYGATVTYGRLAIGVGRPGAVRAVGRIMAANRLPIFIPCHRVLGCDGKLVGYSGGAGIITKKWLLDFEQRKFTGKEKGT